MAVRSPGRHGWSCEPPGPGSRPMGDSRQSRRDTGRRALAGSPPDDRRSGVVLVIAAGVGAVTAATADPPRTALRRPSTVPVDPTAFASPLSDFRRYTKDLADDVLLTVTGLPAGRPTAAGRGGRLRRSAVRDQLRTHGPFIRIGQQRAVAATGTSVTVTVQLDGYRGPFLPAPGEVADLQFDGPRADALADALRYSGPAATGLVPGRFHRRRQLHRDGGELGGCPSGRSGEPASGGRAVPGDRCAARRAARRRQPVHHRGDERGRAGGGHSSGSGEPTGSSVTADPGSCVPPPGTAWIGWA